MILTRHKNKGILALAVLATAFCMGGVTAQAKKGDQGVDWSKYQGTHGRFGYSSDKFAIAQVGGYYDGYFIVQSTYATQVQYAVAQGKRAHTYIYSQFSTIEQAKQMLDYYLPKVQTPAGSIVALDVESGSPNTTAVKYALKRVKAAGYTAVLYGYKNFLATHLNLSSIASSYPLWLAEYPNYAVTRKPNYGYFPSYKNVRLFQFTSTYVAGGLDGNIDLTGITDNGYSGSKAKVTTPAVKAGQKAASATKAKVGDTVKINLTAKHWATGEMMADSVKGQSYKVKQASGSRLLLSGVNSWSFAGNTTIVSVGKAVTTSSAKPDYFTWVPHFAYARRAVVAHSNVSAVGTSKSAVKAYKKGTKLTVKGLKNNRFELSNGTYITANKTYINNLYYTPSGGVKVVKSLSGTFAYKTPALTGKIRRYKRGTQFTVVKIVKYGHTSRIRLTNGSYVSGNKTINIYVR